MLKETDYFFVKNVLLVEDSQSSAMIVESVFTSVPEDLGRAEITHVENLQDAFSLLSSTANNSPFDIVLLDLTLPDSSGLETIIRFREQCADIGIVVLTGTNDEKMGIEAIALGAQNFLFKDETYPKLLIRQTNYAYHRFQQECLLQEAKEQAEMATALKDKYVSLVSHDLRNPLGVIISALTLATNKEKKVTEKNVEECTALALQSSKQLLKMVEDLLDLSRLQQGFIKPICTFNSAYYVVNEIINRLSFMADEKNIDIQNQVSKKSRIYSDRILLNQLIQNLVSNAIKFSHPNSLIRIYSPDGYPATVTVEDYGVGIPQKNIAELTSLETKTSTLGTTGEKGSGIGIPHCNEILMAHNGELHIESEPGVKTTFTARFPEIRPRIMLIDDDKSIIKYLKYVLKELDVDIVFASDGNSALTMLTTDAVPDLLLLDVVLPDIDGLTILEKLKQNPVTQQIPVIMMTGDSKVTTREDALGLGAIDFVEKPIKIEDLIPRVHNIIG